MKHALLPALLALSLALPSAAAADCYVSYKAKKEPPLQLHFGVVQVRGDCPSSSAAASTVARRISSGGWTLLNVVRLSESPPSSSERTDAGAYYLRY